MEPAKRSIYLDYAQGKVVPEGELTGSGRQLVAAGSVPEEAAIKAIGGDQYPDLFDQVKAAAAEGDAPKPAEETAREIIPHPDADATLAGVTNTPPDSPQARGVPGGLGTPKEAEAPAPPPPARAEARSSSPAEPRGGRKG